MLETVNDALLHNFHGSQFCTVALGVVEGNGSVRAPELTLGGHPAPLILRADGSVEAVGAPGSLLGVLRRARPARGRDHDGAGRHAAALHGRRDRDEDEARPPRRRGPRANPGALRRPQRDARSSPRVENEIALRREGDEADDLALLAMRFVNGALAARSS